MARERCTDAQRELISGCLADLLVLLHWSHTTGNPPRPEMDNRIYKFGNAWAGLISSGAYGDSQETSTD